MFTTTRREFLKQVTAVGALASAPSFSAAAEAEAPKSVAAQATKIKAVAFDAYGTLFDVHSVIALAESLIQKIKDAVKPRRSPGPEQRAAAEKEKATV